MGLVESVKTSPLVAPIHAVLRGFEQERRFARKQSSYERRAARSGTRVLEGRELVAALRERLSQRPHAPWPKRKGDLHIFLAYPLHNWEFILPLALAPFGRVSEFEWRRRGYNEKVADWAERRDEMNREMLEVFHAADRAQKVDAVVGYVSSATVSVEVLREMAASGAAIFSFSFDDKLYFADRRLGGRDATMAGIAGAVDLNLTNAPGSRIRYAVEGGLSMFFPEAAHPDFHKPYDLPFEFDVSFVGARYGWRGPFIERLQRLLAPSGVEIACFGRAWPNGPLSDEDLTKLYSRSRINLGFGGVGFSRRITCLKGRDFEVPMSGGLYLTQHNPELALVYEIGKEILTYRDEEDCARVIRETLADPDRAAAIRRAGHMRCLKDHTYEVRWGAPFRAAGLLAD